MKMKRKRVNKAVLYLHQGLIPQSSAVTSKERLLFIGFISVFSKFSPAQSIVGKKKTINTSSHTEKSIQMQKKLKHFGTFNMLNVSKSSILSELFTEQVLLRACDTRGGWLQEITCQDHCSSKTKCVHVGVCVHVREVP